MTAPRITVELGETVNTGSYQSVRASISLAVDVAEGESLEAAAALARAWVASELARAIGDQVPPSHPRASPERRAAAPEARAPSAPDEDLPF